VGPVATKPVEVMKPSESTSGTERIIDRASSADLAQLAFDRGRSPMHITGILVLGPRWTPDLQHVRTAIGRRVGGIPRFTRHLARTPPGCGRPVWVVDSGFDVADHVSQIACPVPGDEHALLDLTAALATTRLARGHSPWRVVLVTGLANGGAALVIVLHHVLADGVGGLAVLSQLMDGAPRRRAAERWTPPRLRDLIADAFHDHLTTLTGIRHGVRALRDTLTVVGRPRHAAPRCSLNEPTGEGRVLVVARANLASLHAVARERDGTVNDVVLSAATGALHTLLRSRGERVDRLAVAMPRSARRSTTATRLGNRVTPSFVVLPAVAEPFGRLSAVARVTRASKAATPGATPTLVELSFRAAGALRVSRPFMRHQRIANTSITDLHGPEVPLSFLGAPVTELIPVTSAAGNMTVVFVALSYAGTLTVTAVADRDACPDVRELGAALQAELDALSVSGRVAS
jgi:diacylglycerol O-acyltransferase